MLINYGISEKEFSDHIQGKDFYFKNGAVQIDFTYGDINSAILSMETHAGLLKLHNGEPIPLERFRKTFTKTDIKNRK